MNRRKKVGLILAVALIVALIVLGLLAYSPVKSKNLYTKKLSNDLEVFVYEKHDAPIVSMLMAVRAGSQVENSDLNGLAHLHEHIFVTSLSDKSTIPEDLRIKVEFVPFVYMGMTSYQYSIYTFSPFMAEDTEKAMILLSDAFVNPWMGKSYQELQQILDQEKITILAEYDRNQSEPYFARERAKIRNMWSEYPSTMDVLGDRNELADARIEELKYIQDRFYIPNNCALIIAGDVEHEEMFDLADKYFGGWEPGEDPFSEYLYKNPPLNRSVVSTVQSDVSQITIEISFIGPGCCEERGDTFPADILLTVLNNPASMFQKRLVDSGLFTSCQVSYLTLPRDSSIDFVGQTTPEKFRQAYKAIFEEVANLGDDRYFSEEEVENAKSHILSREVWNRERSGDYAQTLAFWWTSCGTDYFYSYEKEIKNTNLRDIEKFVDEYLVGEPYVCIIQASQEDRERMNLSEESL